MCKIYKGEVIYTLDEMGPEIGCWRTLGVYSSEKVAHETKERIEQGEAGGNNEERLMFNLDNSTLGVSEWEVCAS